jgi:hypothetical protein
LCRGGQQRGQQQLDGCPRAAVNHCVLFHFVVVFKI